MFTVTHRTTAPDGSPIDYRDEEYEERLGRVQRMWYQEAIWAQRIDPDFQFEVGQKYLTLEGKIVTIVEKSTKFRGYECVKGDDDIWRYNRSRMSADRIPEGLGRTTGSSWDRLTNLIPVAIKG